MASQVLVVVGALLARPGRVEALPVDHGEDEDVDAVHQPQHGEVVALVTLSEMPVKGIGSTRVLQEECFRACSHSHVCQIY